MEQPLDLRQYSVRTDLAIEAHEIALEERLQQKQESAAPIEGSSFMTRRSTVSSCRMCMSRNKERPRSARSRATT
ncbi:Germination protease precursor [Geobacillus sp. BCO2]|nr:Germination protease precursor [Geobacillus sp. BCO2]